MGIRKIDKSRDFFYKWMDITYNCHNVIRRENKRIFSVIPILKSLQRRNWRIAEKVAVVYSIQKRNWAAGSSTNMNK